MNKNIHSDHLADDLVKIFDAARDKDTGVILNEQKLMEAIVIYIVRRDHKVHDSGIETGRMLEKGEIEPEEEA